MNKIEELRIEKEWKRSKLASESGVSRVTIWKLECRGYKAKNNIIVKLADALDVDAVVLREFIK